MGNKNLIITIEREYGSGGRIVGKKLAGSWVFLFMMMKS